MTDYRVTIHAPRTDIYEIVVKADTEAQAEASAIATLQDDQYLQPYDTEEHDMQVQDVERIEPAAAVLPFDPPLP